MDLETEYFVSHKFRFSKQYKLIPLIYGDSFDEIVNNGVEQKDIFGLLSDKENLTSRIIDCQTALLLYALQRPTFLPAYLTQGLDTSIIKDIKYLLSLGILEIEIQTPKEKIKYIYGEEALSHLDKKISKKFNSISSINLKAFNVALKLLPLDHESLASALYRFNHKPVSRTLHAKLYDKKSVKKFFKLGEKDKKSKDFYTCWTPLADLKGWIGFINKKSFINKHNQTSYIYKLYISPNSLNVFQKIFFEVTHLLYECDAFEFKIGDDAYGLQRPDKWVAYFYDKKSLYRAIQMLDKEIGDIGAQEVPFSGQSDLKWLSWGRDPQQTQKEAISWRWLVCSEIAYAIQDLSKEESESRDTSKIWSHVVCRLERENINPNTFEPIE